MACQKYPVTNYTLDIKSNSSQVPSLSFSSDTDEPFVVPSLQEDVVYRFKIVAINSVGNVSSSSVPFCKLIYSIQTIAEMYTTLSVFQTQLTFKMSA